MTTMGKVLAMGEAIAIFLTLSLVALAHDKDFRAELGANVECGTFDTQAFGEARHRAYGGTEVELEVRVEDAPSAAVKAQISITNVRHQGVNGLVYPTSTGFAAGAGIFPIDGDGQGEFGVEDQLGGDQIPDYVNRGPVEPESSLICVDFLDDEGAVIDTIGGEFVGD
jgi:hypothetical protein